MKPYKVVYEVRFAIIDVFVDVESEEEAEEAAGKIINRLKGEDVNIDIHDIELSYIEEEA